MKIINVYANGSPIHSRIITYLLAKSEADENVVINYRGMRMSTESGVFHFHCNKEEHLNERPHVKRFLESLQIGSENTCVNLYVAHSNYLLCKIHAVLQLGTVNYIEDGIGTYAAMIDAELGTDHFARAIGTDVTRSGNGGLNQLLVNHIPLWLEKLALTISKKAWHLNRALLMNLFTVSLRKKEVFFDFGSEMYGSTFLTISKFPRLKVVAVPLSINPPAILAEERFLVLIPPLKIIGELYFEKFVAALLKLRLQHSGLRFDYKSHPSDTENVDYRRIVGNNSLAGDLITIGSSNETAITAYELGYKGLVCYDSSATLYARSFLSSTDFECVDLCKETTGREAFGVSLANELAKL